MHYHQCPKCSGGISPPARGMRQVADAVHQADLVSQVEVGGGFVQQQQGGLLRQRPCQQDALLLPAGKLPHPALCQSQGIRPLHCLPYG